jgi:hypothetical protein
MQAMAKGRGRRGFLSKEKGRLCRPFSFGFLFPARRSEGGRSSGGEIGIREGSNGGLPYPHPTSPCSKTFR